MSVGGLGFRAILITESLTYRVLSNGALLNLGGENDISC